jgi:benzoyl-CoA reductase/2-hydroxyglutaryl-CoA dehydratase subunit BcrC/BadD/HgdB
MAIEDLGIVDRWRAEADAAIKQLEEWTGDEFESAATKGSWKPVSNEVRALVTQRKASGYYSPEAIAARDAEKLAAKKAKKRKQLIDDHDKKIRKTERKLELELFMLDNFEVSNWIYYDHTNELAVNWTNTEKLVTKEEFDSMEKVVANFRTGLSPDGVQLRWQERPKY